MAEKQWCEKCQDYQWSAYRRPELGGKVLCSQHYYEALRSASQTGLVRRPTRVPAYLREEAK